MRGVRARGPGALLSTLRLQRFSQSTDSRDSRPRPARSRPPELRLRVGRHCRGTPAPGEAWGDADKEGRGPTSQSPCSAAWAPPFRQLSPVGPNSVAPCRVVQHFGVAGEAECAGAERPPSHAGGTAELQAPAESTAWWLAAGGGAQGGAGLATLPSPVGMGVWSGVSTVTSSFASRSRERSKARSRFPGNSRGLSPQFPAA